MIYNVGKEYRVEIARGAVAEHAMQMAGMHELTTADMAEILRKVADMLARN